MSKKPSLKVVNSLDKQKWSDFVKNHPHGNIFQTPEMYEVYESTKRYDPIFLAAVDESDYIQALLLAHVIKEFDGILGSFSSRSIIQGGPLYMENERGLRAVELLIQEYDKVAKKKSLYTQIRNMWDVSGIKQILKNEGYEYEEHLNFLVDLTVGEEVLWSNLNKKRRNGIRRARKRGVIIEKITNKKLIEEVYSILQQTYRKAKLPLADISLFEYAFDIMAQKNYFHIFVAKYEDDIIGAILLLCFEGRLFDWYAGALEQHLQLNPNDILPWQAIEWGCNNGMKVYDFGGAGSPREEYGVREFKKQFGGEMVNFGRFELAHKQKKLWLSKKMFKVYRNIMLR